MIFKILKLLNVLIITFKKKKNSKMEILKVVDGLISNNEVKIMKSTFMKVQILITILLKS